MLTNSSPADSRDMCCSTWSRVNSRAYLFAKRCMDVIGAATALLIISPLLLGVAVAIKLTSPGPVFYRQLRLGRDARPFYMLKFRSMRKDADAMRAQLAEFNEADGPVFKIRSDPRVTSVGRFIRKYSIDELPQLWHVLVGTMSLVGPRPPIPEEVASYEEWHKRRLTVKPGLTCIWQVQGRSDVSFDEWMRMDIEYIETRSLLLDIKLLLKTVPAVLGGRGAY
ncbi:MAG: sugar transferase [candidate division WS1 bacterium]|nr:sugar transferase [candidate division WS1 bacterium]